MFSFTKSGCALLVVFFMFRGSSETVEEFSLLYLKQLGYDSFYVGLMPLFGLFTQLTGVPVCAYLSDKFRIRKFALILAVFTSIPAILMYMIPLATGLPCEPSTQKDDRLYFHNQTLTKFINKSFTRERELQSRMFSNLTVNNLPAGDKTYVFEDKSGKKYDSQKILYFLLLCTVNGMFELCRRLTVGLVTVAAITHLKDKKSKFTLYEGIGAAGTGITLCVVSFIAGHFKYTRCGVEIPSFFVAFPVAAAQQCFTLLGVLWLKFDYQDKDDNVNYKTAILTLLKPHYIFILCIGLHVGACNGFITRWQYWYMDKFGGSTTVMGVEGLLKQLVLGTFWCVVTVHVLNTLGEYATMAVSLFLFAISFALLALIKNLWLVILIDNFELAAYIFFYSAVVLYFQTQGRKHCRYTFKVRII